ncbi:MAG: SMI1 / KNR4 family protein [Firmicutes bacterium ADurb.Bin419]|nr:MAG: SMI1 / KNR4 family protein [Firmicutes bacterium ADurb.Bin419]
MWKEFVTSFVGNNKYIKPNSPATIKQVQEVESKLGVLLPKDIKDLLFELNGDSDLILSTECIIEDNLRLREYKEDLVNIENYLLIASNGCGDYYGYEITKDGIKDESIYMWNHEEYDEDFNFIKVASNLKELIELKYNGII